MDYEQMSLQLIDKNCGELKNKIAAMIVQLKKRKVVLFGCGANGNIIFDFLKKNGVTVVAFTDNNPTTWGERYTEDNIVCISPQEAFKLQNGLIMITSKFVKEIEEQIQKAGGVEYLCPIVNIEAFVCIIKSKFLDMNLEDIKSNIKQLFDILEDELSKKIVYFKVWGWFAGTDDMSEYPWDTIVQDSQYLPEGIINLDKESVIVDCGAYIGDTLNNFIDKKILFSKYIAYEMDENNYGEMKEFILTLNKQTQEKIQCYNMGVGDKESKVLYYSKAFSSFVLHSDEGKEIEDLGLRVAKCIPLDAHLKVDDISYIKMDIEGAEMAALKGGRKMIQKSKPQCAICIYHLATDLWEIPLYLHELNKTYSISIRHHLESYYDTVCYAVDRG